MDVAYVDYPSKIKAKRLNGFGASAQEPAIEPENPQPSEPNNDDKDNDKDDAHDVSVEVVIDGKKYSGKLNKAE